MFVYEIVDFKYEPRHLNPMYLTPGRAKEAARELVESGELLHPLYSIEAREVVD